MYDRADVSRGHLVFAVIVMSEQRPEQPGDGFENSVQISHQNWETLFTDSAIPFLTTRWKH